MLRALAKLKKFVTYVHSSDWATREFKRLRSVNKEEGTALVTASDIRWDSHLELIESAKPYQRTMQDLINNAKRKKDGQRKDWSEMDLQPEDWVLLDQATAPLKVMRRITNAFQGDTEVRISMAPQIIRKAEKDLKEQLTKVQPSTPIAKMINLMLDKMNRRYGTWPQAVRFAELLDMRVRDRYMDAKTAEESWEALDAKYQSLVKSVPSIATVAASTTTAETKGGTSSNSTNRSDPWAELLGDVTTQVRLPVLHDEVERYRKLQPISVDSNPLTWWKLHWKEFPILTELARRYLCIMPSSASSERAFSTAGNVSTKKRARLDADILEAQVVLHDNVDLLQTLRIKPEGAKEPYPTHKPRKSAKK
jgi:zinc finger BED domain-containing protein 1 (E3 SUMO-protein ligase ZBED1)